MISNKEAAFLLFRTAKPADHLTIKQVGKEAARKFYFDQLETMNLGYGIIDLYEIIDWHIETASVYYQVH